MSTVTLLRKFAFSGVLSFVLGGTALYAQSRNPQTPPDNSAHNQNQQTTADLQSHTRSDRDMTQQIRKSVIADRTLSTYGHNVKIVTRNGAVTLTGPVHSEQEKRAIEQHAAAICGPEKVTDKITVKQ
jgi:osmotically-inducible protein OsmY